MAIEEVWFSPPISVDDERIYQSFKSQYLSELRDAMHALKRRSERDLHPLIVERLSQAYESTGDLHDQKAVRLSYLTPENIDRIAEASEKNVEGHYGSLVQDYIEAPEGVFERDSEVESSPPRKAYAQQLFNRAITDIAQSTATLAAIRAVRSCYYTYGFEPRLVVEQVLGHIQGGSKTEVAESTRGKTFSGKIREMLYFAINGDMESLSTLETVAKSLRVTPRTLRGRRDHLITLLHLSSTPPTNSVKRLVRFLRAYEERILTALEVVERHGPDVDMTLLVLHLDRNQDNGEQRYRDLLKDAFYRGEEDIDSAEIFGPLLDYPLLPP